MHCNVHSGAVRCDYQVKFMGLVVDEGKNQLWLGFGHGKHSLQIRFESKSISMGFVGNSPSEKTRQESFNFFYNPLSHWVLWIVVFLPLGFLSLYSLIYFKKYIWAEIRG